MRLCLKYVEICLDMEFEYRNIFLYIKQVSLLFIVLLGCLESFSQELLSVVENTFTLPMTLVRIFFLKPISFTRICNIDHRSFFMIPTSVMHLPKH